MEGNTYKAGHLELFADRGSIIVINNATNIRRRVSVPDMRERLAAVAMYGLNPKTDKAEDRDCQRDTIQLVKAVQSVIHDAEEQGDVTQDKVLKALCDEMKITKKYTMLPKALQ